MKLKIILLLLLFTSKLIGQNKLDEKTTIWGYKYYLNNEKIKKQKAIQILSETDFLKANVNTYKQLNKTGNIFGYSGAVLFGVGGGLIITKLLSNEIVRFFKISIPTSTTEKLLVILGSLGVTTGFYFKLKAHKQLKYCLSEFNNKMLKEPTLKLGLTNNGNVGIVLNF